MFKEDAYIGYARVLLINGVNLQPGNVLLLFAPLNTVEFAHAITKEAYALGAKHVEILWSDMQLQRILIEHAPQEELTVVAQAQLDRIMSYRNERLRSITIKSTDTTVMNGVDPELVARNTLLNNRIMQPFNVLRSTFVIPWLVAAFPNSIWAQQVFPDLSPEDAMNRLWDDILHCCYASDPNTSTTEWAKHITNIRNRISKLNAMGIQRLHYKNGLGTDLYAELCDEPLFVGGECVTNDGIVFSPNIPTEEVFCVPKMKGVNGRIVSSMQLQYSGCIIDGIDITFNEGRVTKAFAATGNDVLQSILNTDEGAKHLGECALVASSCATAQCAHAFHDTLYDENMACHVALGNSYSLGTRGSDLTSETLMSRGLNRSLIHVDIMIGTPDMSVTALDRNGCEKPIMFNGEFVD